MDGGRLWPGEHQGAGYMPGWALQDPDRHSSLALPPGVFRASFCPHALGCRDQVIAEDQVEFDISKPEVAVTVKVPERKSLVLVRSASPSACSSCAFLGPPFSVPVWLVTVIPLRN